MTKEILLNLGIYGEHRATIEGKRLYIKKNGSTWSLGLNDSSLRLSDGKGIYIDVSKLERNLKLENQNA